MSTQFLMWFSIAIYNGIDGSRYWLIILLTIADVFIGQCCVYFAFSFSLKSYQKVCACGHYVIFQCCLCCVHSCPCGNLSSKEHSTSFTLK